MQRQLPLLLCIGLPVTSTALSGLLQPTDFAYLGAFRLPGGEERPFAYGGNAMTFKPADNSSGADHPGSLFIMGHDRMPYGDLPDGNQVAEISIPVPVNSRRIGDLPTAAFIQSFRDIAADRFLTLDEIPRTGIAYLDHPATGAKIHLAWGAHFQDPPADVASHAWCNPDLSTPEFRGDWFIGEQNLYSVNGYLFEIPADWADTHVAGRRLASGSMCWNCLPTTPNRSFTSGAWAAKTNRHRQCRR